MTDKEMEELTRQLDWLHIASYLARKEKVIGEILADPSDIRNAIAQELRQRITQIRRQHSFGWSVTKEFADLQNIIRTWNMQRIAPLVQTGVRVVAGGRMGADRTHGNANVRDARKAEYIEAFIRVRKTCSSDEEAFRKVGAQFGVASRTIRRACTVGPVELHHNSRTRKLDKK